MSVRSHDINAFTVDVEEYFHASIFNGVIDRSQWCDLPSSVVRNTTRIMKLLDQHGRLGTFFVLGWIAERYPELVRQIHAEGHEVACHGLNHELVHKQTEQTFRVESYRAKNTLEDLIGEPVTGYRAATFSINKQTPWAHDVLMELGFDYDSSIFPVRHDRYGDPDAPRFPYRVQHRSKDQDLVEFPLSTWEVLGQNLPVSGGGYFRLLPKTLTELGLRAINKKDRHPFVFYTHPWEIDSDQPRQVMGFLNSIRHYRNLDKCEKRLDWLLSSFRFGTCRDVLCELGHLPDSKIRDATRQLAAE